MPDAPAAITNPTALSPAVPTPTAAPATTPVAPAGHPPAPAPGAISVRGRPDSTPSRAKAFDALRKLAKPADGLGRPTTEPAAAPATTTDPAKPAAAAAPAPAKPSETPPAATTPPAGEKPATEPAGAKAKASPWKLVETYKGKLAERERELAEARKQIGDPQMITGLTQRAEAAEARLKELESEMRYHNYAKTQEFREKYQEPYEKAWERAVKDVTQLTVGDEESGNQRPATADDLWAIVSQPLGTATRMAKELFGDDMGSFVMAHHYTKVRELADAQQEALEKARKDGADRDQQRLQSTQALRREVGQNFERIRDEDAKQLDFLKEKEGDNDWNARLTKSVNFVDSTMRASVLDPKLTPEARNTLISQHVAVRNRAIGFSMLKLENSRLKAQIAERDAKIASYEGVQPGGGEGKPGAAATDATVNRATAGGIEAAKARLRGLARPAIQ